jgi:transposase
VTLPTQERYAALQAARQREGTKDFKDQYAIRAGIEGTLSQGIRAFELRRTRYWGLAKTHLQHLVTAAAMNLVRVSQWLAEVPLAKTRKSAFERLWGVPVPA